MCAGRANAGHGPPPRPGPPRFRPALSALRPALFCAMRLSPRPVPSAECPALPASRPALSSWNQKCAAPAPHKLGAKRCAPRTLWGGLGCAAFGAQRAALGPCWALPGAGRRALGSKSPGGRRKKLGAGHLGPGAPSVIFEDGGEGGTCGVPGAEHGVPSTWFYLPSVLLWRW